MGMKISSGTSAIQGGAQAWQQRQQDFQALSQALSSNNVDAAKAAYASMTSNGARKAANNPNSPLAQLGQALQSGELMAAQKAFSQIKAGHGHHNQASASSVNAALPTVSTPTITMGNNVNVFV